MTGELREAMMNEVVNALNAADPGATALREHFPFRDRALHTRRVTRWAERLLAVDGASYEEFDGDALVTAAIFHDVGYSLPGDRPHAERGAAFFAERAAEYGISPERADFITRLIAEHSSKELRARGEAGPELTLLMEADELDEIGAMGIAWDCMAEGALAGQSYERTLSRVKLHAERLAARAERFVTPEARRLCQEKQALSREFVAQLARDLEIT